VLRTDVDNELIKIFENEKLYKQEKIQNKNKMKTKMHTLIAAVLLLTVNCILPTISFAQWQTYPYSPPGSVLTFPDDDGYHPDPSTLTEWWYINLHLIGSAPAYKKYDVMLCYFRKPTEKRIFIVADPVSGIFHAKVNTTFSVFSQQSGHWELSYKIPFVINDSSKWTYPADNKTYSYFFHAEEPSNDDGLDVTVTSNRPPLIVGGDGFIPLGGQGDSSYYYSYTNMKVEGTIKFSGVTDSISSGIGWIDRQWGPFTLNNSNRNYEWFSLQMDKPNTVLGVPQTPSEFNIWQIFSDINSVPYSPEWRIVSSIFPSDSQDTSSTFLFERTGYWYDAANNKYFSHSWRFIEPNHGVNIDMTPNIDNQVTPSQFWEGSITLKGTVNNLPVEGVGFAELVARRDSNILLPSVPAGLTVNSFSDHHSLNWTTSTAGTYPVGGYRVFRNTNNNGYWQYIATTANLFYDDYSAIPDSSYYYTVTSFDNQTATSASDYATAIFVSPLGINFNYGKINFLKIYPNPVIDRVYIKCPEEENVKMQVYSMIGECVLQSELSNSTNDINVSFLSKGIYVIKLTGANWTVQRKLIKE